MRKLIVALGMTTAVCLTSAAVAFADGAPPPVQAATQSATTSQQAAALSSAQQVTADERQRLDPDQQPGQRRQRDADEQRRLDRQRRQLGVDVAVGDQSQAGSGVQSSQFSPPGTDQLRPQRCPRRSSTAPRTRTSRHASEPRRRRLDDAVEHRGLHGQRRERRGDASRASTQSQGSSCGCGGSAGGVQSANQPAGTVSRPHSRPRRPSRSIPRTRTSRCGSTALATMETSPRPTR